MGIFLKVNWMELYIGKHLLYNCVLDKIFTAFKAIKDI